MTVKSVENSIDFVDAQVNSLNIPCPHYDPDNIAHCKLAKPTITLCSGYLVLDGVKCERYAELVSKRGKVED